jgi:hypothetical protein
MNITIHVNFFAIDPGSEADKVFLAWDLGSEYWMGSTTCGAIQGLEVETPQL